MTGPDSALVADPGRVVDVEVADGLTAIGGPRLVAIALGHLLGNA